MAKRPFEKSFDAYRVTQHPLDPFAGFLVVSPERADGRRVLIRQCETFFKDAPVESTKAVLNDCLDFFSLFDHTSLLPILDRGTFKGHPSFIVPYYEKIYLWHILKKNLPIEVVKYVMLCIFDALDHFYSRLSGAPNLDILCQEHITERAFDVDTSGRIIIVYPDPHTLFVETYAALHNIKLCKLTPKQYHPPENLRNNEKSKELSDVFMVGSFFWTFLTDERFAAGESEFDMWRYVLRGEYPAPSALREDIPPDMDALCMSMIEKDPQVRCPSFAAAREALLAVNVSQDVGREMLARLACAEHTRKIHTERQLRQKFQRNPTAQTPATSTSTSSWWSRWWSRLRKN